MNVRKIKEFESLIECLKWLSFCFFRLTECCRTFADCLLRKAMESMPFMPLGNDAPHTHEKHVFAIFWRVACYVKSAGNGGDTLAFLNLVVNDSKHDLILTCSHVMSSSNAISSTMTTFFTHL